MPIIKAAIKHLRKSEKLRKVNRNRKDNLKDAIKEITKLAAEKKMAEFAKMLPQVMSMIDKAAKHHQFHKNRASRKKAKLARMMKTK